MNHGGLSRVTVGERLVPHIEPFFWTPRMVPTALGYEGQCGVMRRNLSSKRLKVSSGSK